MNWFRKCPPRLSAAALGQLGISQAPVSIVICAVYARTTTKYSERGIRFAHFEAGHIAQNIHLQAESLGLVSFPVAAFHDAEVKKYFLCRMIRSLCTLFWLDSKYFYS